MVHTAHGKDLSATDKSLPERIDNTKPGFASRPAGWWDKRPEPSTLPSIAFAYDPAAG